MKKTEIKTMKKIILFSALIFGAQFLTVQTAWAINCSVKYTEGYFSKSEVRIALSDITGVLFQAKVAFLEEIANKKSERCHFGIDVVVFPDTLSVVVKYGEQSYTGGSNKLGLIGFREAVVRAFYQETLFRRKICRLFGKTYNLNCSVFE